MNTAVPLPASTPANTRTHDKQCKILDAATDLFLARGYDAVSLDDILEKVGGSKTTLYSYYGGKEGLFAAMVQRAVIEKLMPLMTLDVKHLDPKAGLHAIGCLFLSLISDPRSRSLYRMMIGEAERFPELANAFYESGPAPCVRTLSHNLERWQKKGLLRKGDCAGFAVQFMGMITGHFSLRSLLGLSSGLSNQEIEDWVSRCVTLFLEGTAR